MLQQSLKFDIACYHILFLANNIKFNGAKVDKRICKTVFTLLGLKYSSTESDH